MKPESPTSTQSIFISCPNRIAAWVGGFGSGGTWAGTAIWARDARAVDGPFRGAQYFGAFDQRKRLQDFFGATQDDLDRFAYLDRFKPGDEECWKSWRFHTVIIDGPSEIHDPLVELFANDPHRTKYLRIIAHPMRTSPWLKDKMRNDEKFTVIRSTEINPHLPEDYELTLRQSSRTLARGG